MFNFNKKLIISLLCSVGYIVAFAQDTKTLDEVLVKTNRFEQKQSQMGKVVTVLGDSLLRTMAGRSLTDVLSQQVGITAVGSQQPLGSTQLLYMRGAKTGYTLILIDGQPVYDPSAIEGSFDLNLLSLNQIARIEIMKGGASTMYGSDAMAGVINIITKNAHDKPMRFDQSLTFGSYQTLNIGTGSRGRIGKMGYHVQTSIVQSKGFSSAFDEAKKGNFDADGLRQIAVRAGFNYDLSKNVLLRTSALITKYKADLDAGAMTDDRDYKATNQMRQLGLGLDYLLAKGKVIMNFTTNKSSRLYLDDSTHVPVTAFNSWTRSEYIASSNFGEIYVNLSPNEHFQLLAGVDYRTQNTDQSYVSLSNWGKYEAPKLDKAMANIQNFSIFSSMLLKNLSFFNLELGGRWNSHSTFGNNFTYTFNPYLLLHNRFKILANVASSFKAPTLYQLFSPYGNKTLKPETALTADFGLQIFGKKQQDFARVAYFKRSASDVIFFQSLSKDPYGIYVNFENQADNGIEIDGQKRIKNVRLSANYTYLTGQLTTKKNGKDTTYNNLLRRPKHSFNASLGYDFSEKLSTSINVKTVSDRFDSFYNQNTYKTESVTLKAYTTIDLGAVYRVSKNFNFFVDFRNITNVEYFDLYGFNSRRFNFNIGLSFVN